MTPNLRPILLAICLFPLLGLSQATRPASKDYPNPLIEQRADPHVLKHTDGLYYFTASVPEFDRVILRKAPTIKGLASAEEKVLWRKRAEGEGSKWIWAPEVHHFDRAWHVYFTAGKIGTDWVKQYVLRNPSPDPFEGAWEELGELDTGVNMPNLDATIFEHRGKRYISWSQHDGKLRSNCLYLGLLETPTKISRRVMISWPEFDWERDGPRFGVNEGAAFLTGGDRVFLAYSASIIDARYCLGLLWASADADLLDPKSWTKSPGPVFATSETNHQYGPGHNSFVKAEDNQTDLLIYHARPYRDPKPNPLDDPNRHTRVAVVKWTAGGFPDFGVPRPDGARTPTRPATTRPSE